MGRALGAGEPFTSNNPTHLQSRWQIPVCVDKIAAASGYQYSRELRGSFASILEASAPNISHNCDVLKVPVRSVP